MKLAVENDLIVRLEYRPGDFVISGSALMKVSPAERCDRDLSDRIRDTFVIGTQRTHLQDIEFSIHQLVEVAVRALSPGINDPFTAISCIDRLAAALCLLAQRSIPSPYRHDENDILRVIARVVTFAGVVDSAFNQIRQYGRSSAAVTIRLLEAITRIAECTRRPSDREALLSQARMIDRGSQGALLEERDRHDVWIRFVKACEALGTGADCP
jgi:uncharacterized membrane protein